jgi:hypothetical protein
LPQASLLDSKGNSSTVYPVLAIGKKLMNFSSLIFANARPPFPLPNRAIKNAIDIMSTASMNLLPLNLQPSDRLRLATMKIDCD